MALENQTIQKHWDEAVGRTTISRLQPPKIYPKEPKPNSTGLYIRYYDKIDKAHCYAVALYDPSELPGSGTLHLRALERFIKEYDCKVSFCLGFALDEKLMVKRNSCSNVKATGKREMDDKWYFQLVHILQQLGRRFTDVTSDDPSGLAVAMQGMRI